MGESNISHPNFQTEVQQKLAQIFSMMTEPQKYFSIVKFFVIPYLHLTTSVILINFIC